MPSQPSQVSRDHDLPSAPSRKAPSSPPLYSADDRSLSALPTSANVGLLARTAFQYATWPARIAALAVGSALAMSVPLRCQSATLRVKPKVLSMKTKSNGAIEK